MQDVPFCEIFSIYCSNISFWNSSRELLFISIPDQWLPDEINDGHYEYFCFLLGGLMVVDAIFFIPVAIWYKRTKLKSKFGENFPFSTTTTNKGYSSLDEDSSKFGNKSSSF